jgi:hypothetical protein
MPGLIGSQGVRPGALNMNRVFRALRYRSEQAQYVTFHRPTIYKTDSYGIPSGTVGASELLIPNLPAIIRPAVTADYQQERAGNNIIGAARIYTPNIHTIKNYPNFDQDNNTNFNEIEGWDRLITNYRTIYSAFTSGNTGSPTPWVNTGGNTPESDGESILISGASTAVTYKTTGNKNVLEADRLRFKIKTNDNNLVLSSVVITNTDAQTLTYTPSSLTITADSWLTIDAPFISGTSATSIYQGGTRYATTVAGTFDYETTLDTIAFNWTGPEGDSKIVYLKEVEFYKSVSWHVHSLKDMTDGYIIFNCVRTSGRDDAKRRAYE